MNTSASNKDELVERVLQDPEAPAIAAKVARELKKEQQRRKEFYNSVIAEEQKAEFINGEVIIQSPVKKIHNDITSNIYKILDTYATIHDLGFVGYEKIMIQLTRNSYEPDVCYFNASKSAEFEESTSLFPPPELAVEVVSPKTVKRDRGIKFEDYQRHGVIEYWIVIPEDKVVEQYLLDEKKAYQLHIKSDSGNIKVATMEGLTIPIPSFFDKKLAQAEIRKILTA